MHLNSEQWLCGFGVLVSVLLRCCTSLHSYSGQHSPPRYGDYEAQRHWMEVSINLPAAEWYVNTTDNDLDYWGLDYPPLTAYHSWLCGRVSQLIEPKSVTLHRSRGYETETHKLFMRYTVLIADCLVYVPAILLFFYYDHRLGDRADVSGRVKGANVRVRVKRISSSVCTLLALLYPGLIIIDHGHFQYNCVSLGLTVYAVAFLSVDRYLLASVSFCLALNYKQMALYHAIPFFVYLLSSCVPKPGQGMVVGVAKLCKIGCVVLATFALLWAPFIMNRTVFAQVVHRLFPLARGVFEDKVSNFWCALNVFYKLKYRFTNLEMARYCIISTLIAVLPSSIDLFLRPNFRKFVPALINSSLGFYLFSFQVHEKSVLLAAVPVCLYFREKPVMCFWFLIVSTVSMFPLFVQDGLAIAFFGLVVFFTAAFRIAVDYTFKRRHVNDPHNFFLKDVLLTLLNLQGSITSNLDIVDVTFKHCLRNRKLIQVVLLYVTLWMSLGGCAALVGAMLIFDPPQNYPHLFPLMISVYCCVHFIGFFVYFNVCQLKIPQAFEIVRTRPPLPKTKSS